MGELKDKNELHFLIMTLGFPVCGIYWNCSEIKSYILYKTGSNNCKLSL